MFCFYYPDEAGKERSNLQENVKFIFYKADAGIKQIYKQFRLTMLTFNNGKIV